MIELLRHGSFARFWIARIASVAALQVLLLAIGWHMYELTGRAWDLGLVGLFQFAPALLSTLPAGHAADRLHRARLAALCMGAMAVIAGLLAVATARHAVGRELLLGMSVVLGAVRPFQMSAQQALVPMLVPAPLLGRATALSSAGQQVAVIGGPALGGLLFVAGVGTVYLACAGLFCVAALLCALVRYDYRQPRRVPVSLDTLLAGARFIWRSPLLLGVISLDLFAVLLGGATALLPIFADRVLHVGPPGLGLLRCAPAIGALAVGLVLARRAPGRRVGRKMLAAVAVYGASVVVFGLSTSFLLSLAALAVSGAADMVSVVIRQTLVQLETPDEMRGRVAAVSTIFIGASNQLGEFESGFSAAAFGPVASVTIGGVGAILVSVAWSRMFRQLATRESLA